MVTSVMSWAEEDLAALKRLWSSGQSAAEIAGRLGYSRNAVCAKLTRLGLKRGRKPPTAKPMIVSVSKRRMTSLAACTRPVAKVVSSRKPVARQPQQFSKKTLYDMLAEAVRNTGNQDRAHNRLRKS
jgi:GcrA cell cycle regulator